MTAVLIADWLVTVSTLPTWVTLLISLVSADVVTSEVIVVVVVVIIIIKY